MTIVATTATLTNPLCTSTADSAVVQHETYKDGTHDLHDMNMSELSDRVRMLKYKATQVLVSLPIISNGLVEQGWFIHSSSLTEQSEKLRLRAWG